jgi:hypothetical protein
MHAWNFLAQQTIQALQQQNASLVRQNEELREPKRHCVGDGLGGPVNDDEFSYSPPDFWSPDDSAYMEAMLEDNARLSRSSLAPLHAAANRSSSAQYLVPQQPVSASSGLAPRVAPVHPAVESRSNSAPQPVRVVSANSSLPSQPVRLVVASSGLAQGAAAEDSDESEQECELDKSEPNFPQVFTTKRSNFPKHILQVVKSIELLRKATERFSRDSQTFLSTNSAAEAVLAGLRSVKDDDLKALQKDGNNAIEPLLQAWKTACQQVQQMPILRKHFGMKNRS